MRAIYLSFLGVFISIIQNIIGFIFKPFMVYGYFCNKSKMFNKHTRISSSAKFINKKMLFLGDYVWIGHYCLIDCIGGVNVGEGVNISSHTVIYSHSSHDSIRLLGREFIKIEADKRPGYKIAPVNIGAFSFIGTSSIILPGVTIGTGCIIGAGSLVNKNIPDYSIAVGNPIRIIGDTRERDAEMYPDFINSSSYYNNLNY